MWDSITSIWRWLWSAPRGLRIISRNFVAQQRYKSDEYKHHLEIEKIKVNERLTRNACPKARLSSFRVDGYVAKGGFGCLYKATHVTGGTTHALKLMIKPKRRTDETKDDKEKREKGIRRLVFEKKLSYAAKSEFILSAQFAFQDAENLYLITPYAPYGDLSRFLEPEAMSEATVRMVAVQLIFGIEYLHNCYIAHRDLKPENILVFGDLYIKIADLGCARQLTEVGKQRFHSKVGTMHFMAPEIWLMKAYGRACDWWSLGIVLYELLYRKHPFGDFADSIVIGQSIVKKPLRWPWGVSPELRVNDFIAQLLNKDPGQRLGGYQDGAECVKRHNWLGEWCFSPVYNKEIVFDTDVGEQPFGPCELQDHGPATDDPDFAEF